MSKRFHMAILAAAIVSTFAIAAPASAAGMACASGSGEHAGKGKGIGVGIGGGNPHNTLTSVGLTADQHLVCFSDNEPGDAKMIGMVTGLMAGDKLVGIDFRVQDGMLYGVSKTGGVYKIDTSTAVATLVSQLTITLSGERFGVDFNPAADRLRIVSDTGQNLRHNINAGGVTLNDGALNYTAGTPAAGIVGAAYTNNDTAAASGTTLFVLDAALDQVVLQSPPNNGSLVATGKLGVDTATVAGFDIYSSLSEGVAGANRGMAVLAGSDGASTLYAVNLLTGKATRRGAFSSHHQVVDIAIALNQD